MTKTTIEALRELVEEMRMYCSDYDGIDGSRLERLSHSWSGRIEAALAALETSEAGVVGNPTSQGEGV